MLWEKDYIPVVASVGISEDDKIVGSDSDRVSTKIAIETKVDTLVLLTDVDGVLDSNGKLIEEISSSKAKLIMEGVTGGMKTKILMAVQAAIAGVKQVFIASGLREDPIIKALNHDNCTKVTK